MGPKAVAQKRRAATSATGAAVTSKKKSTPKPKSKKVQKVVDVDADKDDDTSSSCSSSSSSSSSEDEKKTTKKKTAATKKKSVSRAAPAVPVKDLEDIITAPQRNAAVERGLDWYAVNHRLLPWRQPITPDGSLNAAFSELKALLYDADRLNERITEIKEKLRQTPMQNQTPSTTNAEAIGTTAVAEEAALSLPSAVKNEKRPRSGTKSAASTASKTKKGSNVASDESTPAMPMDLLFYIDLLADLSDSGNRNDGSSGDVSVVSALFPSTVTPYGIWISEIMCQQTQVATVVPYWLRWMVHLPDPKSLADADPDTVRALWAGLGFYRRADNLVKGAKYVVELASTSKHSESKNTKSKTTQGSGSVANAPLDNEEFELAADGAQATATGTTAEEATLPPGLPTTYQALLLVPGIGPYTAGAIASVCFGEGVPAVDGNVLRVVTRIAGREGQDVKDLKVGRQVTKDAAWLHDGLASLPSAVKSQSVTDTLARNFSLPSSSSSSPAAVGSAAAHTALPPSALPTQAMNVEGIWNQAVMEVGATVCKPGGDPKCAACPFQEICRASSMLKDGTIDTIDGVIPLKSKAVVRTDVRVVSAILTVPVSKNSSSSSSLCVDESSDRKSTQLGVVLVRRRRGALLAESWDFPEVSLATVTDSSKGKSKKTEQKSSAPTKTLSAELSSTTVLAKLEEKSTAEFAGATVRCQAGSVVGPGTLKTLTSATTCDAAKNKATKGRKMESSTASKTTEQKENSTDGIVCRVLGSFTHLFTHIDHRAIVVEASANDFGLTNHDSTIGFPGGDMKDSEVAVVPVAEVESRLTTVLAKNVWAARR